MNTTRSSTTYLFLSGAMLFWGLSFVATKLALQTIPTFTLVFSRFAMASCFFIPLMLRRNRMKFDRTTHVKLFLLALFEPGLYFVFETLGLQRTSAPKTALIIATIPIVVMFCAMLLLGERIEPKKRSGVFISFGGIVLLVAGDPQFRHGLGGSLFGDLLILGAVFSAAFYIICARDLAKRCSAVEMTGIQVAYGAVFFTPAFLWELPRFDWSAVSATSLGALGYLTFFATIAAFLCYNHALTQVPAAHAALFINGIPVVTAVAAWGLLDEKLTLLQTFGGALVLSAVYLTTLPQKPKNVRPVRA